LASQDGAVQLVAAKAIHIKTQAGARISIEGGNIEIHAPGTLTIHKSSLNKQGPDSLSVAMPILSKTPLSNQYDQTFVLRAANSGKPLKHMPFLIEKADGSQVSGVTDAEGKSPLLETAFQSEPLRIIIKTEDLA
jgi:type VI secretion system secreted protein VgrG